MPELNTTPAQPSPEERVQQLMAELGAADPATLGSQYGEVTKKLGSPEFRGLKPETIHALFDLMDERSGHNSQIGGEDETAPSPGTTSYEENGDLLQSPARTAARQRDHKILGEINHLSGVMPPEDKVSQQAINARGRKHFEDDRNSDETAEPKTAAEETPQRHLSLVTTVPIELGRGGQLGLFSEPERQRPAKPKKFPKTLGQALSPKYFGLEQEYFEGVNPVMLQAVLPQKLKECLLPKPTGKLGPYTVRYFDPVRLYHEGVRARRAVALTPREFETWQSQDGTALTALRNHLEAESRLVRAFIEQTMEGGYNQPYNRATLGTPNAFMARLHELRSNILEDMVKAYSAQFGVDEGRITWVTKALDASLFGKPGKRDRFRSTLVVVNQYILQKVEAVDQRLDSTNYPDV